MLRYSRFFQIIILSAACLIGCDNVQAAAFNDSDVSRRPEETSYMLPSGRLVRAFIRPAAAAYSNNPADHPEYTPELFRPVRDYRPDGKDAGLLSEKEQCIFDCAPVELRAWIDLLDCPLAAFRINNLLLLGKTGTGKTVLAEVIAKYTKRKFVKIRTPVLGNAYYNSESDNLERVMSRYVSSNKPVVLLLDFIECLGQGSDTNAEQTINTVTTFQRLMRENRNPNLLVVGTSENFRDIHPAIRDAFTERYALENPDSQGIKRILAVNLREYKIIFTDADVAYIASLLVGPCPRDLKHFVENIVISIQRKNFEEAQNDPDYTETLSLTKQCIDLTAKRYRKSSGFYIKDPTAIPYVKWSAATLALGGSAWMIYKYFIQKQ